MNWWSFIPLAAWIFTTLMTEKLIRLGGVGMPPLMRATLRQLYPLYGLVALTHLWPPAHWLMATYALTLGFVALGRIEDVKRRINKTRTDSAPNRDE